MHPTTKAWLAAATGFGATFASLLMACGSGQGSKSGLTAADSGGSLGPAEASANASGGDGSSGDDGEAGPPQAFVRIVHASPDSPGLDVCVAPHGTGAFQGPLLAQLAAILDPSDGGQADAASVGIDYTQVSAYVPVPVGQLDVRIVPAGAASCASALGDTRAFIDDGGAEDAADAGGPADSGATEGSAPEAGWPDAAPDGGQGISDVTGLPPLGAGAYGTLLVAGDRAPVADDAPLSATLLVDNVVLTGGIAVLRVVDAIPSAPSLDFGLGGGADWLPLVTGVRFGQAGTQTAPGEGLVDPNGYLPIAAYSAQTMSARSASNDAGADLAMASGVEIDPGSIATMLAVGGKTGDATNAPALILCIDNQPSGGLLSDCSVEPR